MFRGRLHEAEVGFRRAIEMAKGLPDVAGAYNQLGIIYWAWNDLEASATELEKAIAADPGNPQSTVASYLYTSGTRLAQGDTDAATEALQEVDRLLATGKATARQHARVAAYHAAIALVQDDREAASKWLDSISAYEGLLYDPIVTMRLIHRRLGEAIGELLRSDYEKYAKEGLQWYLILIRIGQALASSEPDEALSFLAEALAMGKPEGHIRTFVAWGAPLAPLLKEAISKGIEPEYARKLLDIIEAEERQHKIKRGETRASSGGLLSERELEVLRLVAEGLSNHEIARKLTISLSTAKTHVYHLFDKLGARDRIQAVTRAKQLKVI